MDKSLIKIRLIIIYKSRVVMKIINNFMTRLTLQWLQWNIVVYMTVYVYINLQMVVNSKNKETKNWVSDSSKQ